MRIAFTALLIIHGLIHLMGFAKAFGLAELPQLAHPISRPMGALWLAAALLMIASAFTPWRWFWLIGAVAVGLSSGVIFTAWHDAKLGLAANAIVLLGVGYAFASQGPISLAAEYRRNLASVLTNPGVPPIVTEADIEPLPAPVQRYLRVNGLIDPALRWDHSDASTARVAFTRGAHTVRATLHFNDTGELVDFVSDDRSRASPDGKTFTPERWSTPLSEYRSFGARRVATRGKVLTHARDGAFAYGEFALQSVEYNISSVP